MGEWVLSSQEHLWAEEGLCGGGSLGSRSSCPQDFAGLLSGDFTAGSQPLRYPG